MTRHRQRTFRQPTRAAWWLAAAVLLLATGSANELSGQDHSGGLDGEPREQGVDFSYPPHVEEASRNVLARPEFRNLPRLELGSDGQIADPLRSETPEREEPNAPRVPSPAGGALAEFIGALFGGAISMAVVVVLVLVVGGILALILLGLRRWERSESTVRPQAAAAADDDEAELQRMPGDRPPDAWLAAAREAAGQGRFEEALSLLLLGALGHTERAGLIRPRRGLTYRDYLRAVPRSSRWHATLDRLIREYAPVGFGRRLATADAFQAVVEPYEAALNAEPTPGGSIAREDVNDGRQP